MSESTSLVMMLVVVSAAMPLWIAWELGEQPLLDSLLLLAVEDAGDVRLELGCELGESSELSLRWRGRGFDAARLLDELGISAISH